MKTFTLLFAILLLLPTLGRAQKPELVVQTGHSEMVNSLAFSPDGSLLASGGSDRTIKVWDVATAKQLCAFSLDWRIQRVAFTQDGKSVVGLGAEIAVFEISTGRKTSQIDNLAGEVIAYNPQKDIAASTSGGKITLFSVGGGKTLRTFPAPTKVAGALEFSPDGQELAIGNGGRQEVLGGPDVSGDKPGAIFLYDLTADKVVKTLQAGSPVIEALAFSPDGSQIAASSFHETQFMNTVQDVQVEVWDSHSGAVLRTLKPRGSETGVSCLAFSQDAKLLAGAQGGAIMSNDNLINLWNLRSGELLPPLLSDYKGAYALAFQPTGGILASSGLAPSVLLWDAERNQEFARLRSRTGAIHSASILPGGVLAVTTDWCLQFWSLSTGRQIRTISRRFYGATAQSATGKLLTAEVVPKGEAQEQITVWEANSGEEKCSLPPPPIGISIYGYALSPDDKMLMCLTGKSLGVEEVEIWSLAPCQKIFHYAAPANLRWLTFHPNSRLLVAQTAGGRSFLDVKTGKAVTVSPEDQIAPLSTTDGGILSASRRDVTLRDPVTHKAKFRVFSPTLLSDGLNPENRIEVWDETPKKLRFTLIGHTDEVTSLAVTPNGRLLVSAGKDGICRFWSLKDGKEIAAFTPIDWSEWILWTPDNYYCTSKGALAGVAFRVGNRAFPLEQFDLKFNRPDIVLGRLGMADPALLGAYGAAHEKRLKKMDFTEAQLGNDFHLPILALTTRDLPLTTLEKMLRVSVHAADTTATLDRLQVFVNDVPVNFSAGDQSGIGSQGLSLRDKPVKSLDTTLTLPLSVGANKIQISVLNNQGAESLKQTVNITYDGPATKPDLYVVTVGVSKYAQSNYDLNYAAKDAGDIAALWESKKDSFANIHILPITDTDATRDNILTQARALLKQSQVDDEVVLFFAGHGMLDDKLDYYYGTTDNDFAHPAARGLPYDAIEGLLDGIPARKKLLLIDTCHAGEVDKDTNRPASPAGAGTRGGPSPAVKVQVFPRAGYALGESKADPHPTADYLQELFADLRRGSGATVISAASGVGYSLESAEWHNGVFTASVLEGLKTGKADKNGDGQVTVSELRDYVLARVQELTNGQQVPTSRRENLDNDFAVY